jgi:hypothetical protein
MARVEDDNWLETCASREDVVFAVRESMLG